MNNPAQFALLRRKAFGFFVLATIVFSAPLECAPLAPSSSHAELVTLFTEWRAFQKPKLVEGVPDYSVAAMAEQQKGLAAFQARLKAQNLRDSITGRTDS